MLRQQSVPPRLKSVPTNLQLQGSELQVFTTKASLSDSRAGRNIFDSDYRAGLAHFLVQSFAPPSASKTQKRVNWATILIGSTLALAYAPTGIALYGKNSLGYWHMVSVGWSNFNMVSEFFSKELQLLRPQLRFEWLPDEAKKIYLIEPRSKASIAGDCAVAATLTTSVIALSLSSLRDEYGIWPALLNSAEAPLFSSAFTLFKGDIIRLKQLLTPIPARDAAALAANFTQIRHFFWEKFLLSAHEATQKLRLTSNAAALKTIRAQINHDEEQNPTLQLRSLFKTLGDLLVHTPSPTFAEEQDIQTLSKNIYAISHTSKEGWCEYVTRTAVCALFSGLSAVTAYPFVMAVLDEEILDTVPPLRAIGPFAAYGITRLLLAVGWDNGTKIFKTIQNMHKNGFQHWIHHDFFPAYTTNTRESSLYLFTFAAVASIQYFGYSATLLGFMNYAKNAEVDFKEFSLWFWKFSMSVNWPVSEKSLLFIVAVGMAVYNSKVLKSFSKVYYELLDRLLTYFVAKHDPNNSQTIKQVLRLLDNMQTTIEGKISSQSQPKIEALLLLLVTELVEDDETLAKYLELPTEDVPHALEILFCQLPEDIADRATDNTRSDDTPTIERTIGACATRQDNKRRCCSSFFSATDSRQPQEQPSNEAGNATGVAPPDHSAQGWFSWLPCWNRQNRNTTGERRRLVPSGESPDAGYGATTQRREAQHVVEELTLVLGSGTALQ